MSKFAALFTLLVAVLTCGLFTAPAQAQRTRVFVASYGSDTNPCTFGSPCKTFQQAVNVVAANGEVTAIDSAGFGPIAIHKSVTITSPAGVEAGIVPVAHQAGIDINAGPTDKIILRGLTLNGTGVDQSVGIRLDAGGSLIIQNCVIENFESSGVLITPQSSSTFSVSDTQVLNNLYGIYIQPSGGTNESIAGTVGFLNHVDVEYNTVDGITANVAADQLLLLVNIDESVSANNGGAGVITTGSGFPGARVYMRTSNIYDNFGTGLSDSATHGSITITRSMIVQNGLDFTGSVTSYGDNNFVDNLPGGGTLGHVNSQ
jgi:hypothetical protein